MENNVVYDAVEGVKLKADELLSDCESIGGGGGINSIQSSVTQLLGKGTVKSVQRGVSEVNTDVGADNKIATIPISTIDPAKSWLWIDVGNNNAPHESVGYYAASLSSNAITVSFGLSSRLYLIRWQVIEFY